MFQLRDRLFAGTAHEMAHRKGPRVDFFEIMPLQRDFQIDQSVVGPFSHRAEDGKMGASELLEKANP